MVHLLPFCCDLRLLTAREWGFGCHRPVTFRDTNTQVGLMCRSTLRLCQVREEGGGLSLD